MPPQNNSRIGVVAAAGLIATVVALSGCSGKTALRGHLPREEQLSQIKIGETTRDGLIEIIGTPSTVGTFDDKTWYYIGRKSSQFAFFNEETTEQQVLAIYFDDDNRVQMVQRYDADDGRTVEVLERKTPTVGKEMSLVRQLLGNAGKFK